MEETQAAIKLNKPPILFKRTQKLLAEVSSQLDSVLITYWNNPGGSVCHNDVIALHAMLEKIGKQDNVYLFIKSSGGSGLASLRIVNLLRSYVQRITVLIPLECASAATMIALGADEIHMGAMAYLTAVDTSLVHDLSPIDRDNDRVSVSQDELKRVIRLWGEQRQAQDSNPYEALFKYVHPLVIGAIDRADSLSIKLCTEILSYHIAELDRAKEISQMLNSSYPSHSYPITLKEALRIGINAKPLDESINQSLLKLNQLYSEMGQRALTDYDETKYHNNEILNIIEVADLQLYYQVDKDWYYRAEERRWVPMNDQSCWNRYEIINGKPKKSRFHVV